MSKSNCEKIFLRLSFGPLVLYLVPSAEENGKIRGVRGIKIKCEASFIFLKANGEYFVVFQMF